MVDGSGTKPSQRQAERFIARAFGASTPPRRASAAKYLGQRHRDAFGNTLYGRYGQDTAAEVSAGSIRSTDRLGQPCEAAAMASLAQANPIAPSAGRSERNTHGAVDGS